MKTRIMIEKYSEKAHVVLGDTRPIKDELKRSGARFNKYLTHPITRAKPTAGWIISSKRVERLTQWVKDVRIDIEIIRSLYNTTEGQEMVDAEIRDQKYDRVNSRF